ncbi:MAG: hypothetical protein OEZ43_10900 [Gammaproteobacteria bacterium]|nr:hypothetical protein [Gammaproteobacteria bacterium]
MFTALFKTKPLLEEEYINWMLDTFAWALRNFDAKTFREETILVVPSNDMFPGRASSAHEMAGMVFERVVNYSGLNHWPLQLIDENDATGLLTPTLTLPDAARGKNSMQTTAPGQAAIPITYSPYAVNNPEVLIAHFAHVLAHYLGSLAKEPPPGGQENWPHITELLAVFLGFGVIMANTAFTNKVRSCGSCAGPIVERTNFLSQWDMTYALAIFCTYKGIDKQKVKPFLKASLWPFFKKALKDIGPRINSK